MWEYTATRKHHLNSANFSNPEINQEWAGRGYPQPTSPSATNGRRSGTGDGLSFQDRSYGGSAAALGNSITSPGPVVRSPSVINPGLGIDTVAAALERDLEDERRERREEVGFIHRIGARERELLLHRSDALQRQLGEAKQLWDHEKALLSERLATAEAALQEASNSAAVSAASEKATLQRAEERELASARTCQAESALALSLRHAEQGEQKRLEAEAMKWSSAASEFQAQQRNMKLELEKAKQDASAAAKRADDLERRLQHTESERQQSEKLFQEAHSASSKLEADALKRLTQDFEEQRQSTLRETTMELSELRAQVQRSQLAQQHSELEEVKKLEKLQANAEDYFSKLKQEYEEDGQNSLTRALWQLQVADECILTMRQRNEQEADALVRCQAELSKAQLELAEESAACRCMALSASKCENEELALSKKVRSLEEALQNQSREHLDVLSQAARERQEVAALVRNRGGFTTSSRVDVERNHFNDSRRLSKQSNGTNGSYAHDRSKELHSAAGSPGRSRLHTFDSASPSWEASSLGILQTPSKVMLEDISGFSPLSKPHV
eukprot:TRINITY_DN38729_c0_g1_i1.p1 TRINITY_DN38729_c0_g1~~TRINITY_DN38729_c0_g1_i1.p1  ORF type:complete len:560 (+),score=143.54 TRINITY_DN38729_c0_g1_i1:74-1753(+)